MAETEQSTSSVPGISRGTRRYVLGLLVVIYTFNFIDRQILAILLPAIKEEFLVSDTVLGLLAGTAFAVFYATLGIPIGQIADRWSRRNMIAISLAMWSAMTAASGLVTNFAQLALARIGVGIGEAGCSPAAHSLISDYYPPEQRSTAMGIYTVGISIGIMIAYLAGGWVVENIGWREAFLIVGIPGIVLAIVVWLTIKEPQRGISEGRIDAGDKVSIVAVGRFLAQRRSFINMAFGAALAAFLGYAVANFFPTFLSRSFGLPFSEIGVYLGLIYGIAGGAGFAAGGYFADRMAKHEIRYSMWVISAAIMLSWLFAVPVYMASTVKVTLIASIIPTVFSNFYLASTLANTQSLVGLRMRGVASAIVLFIINIIGLGLGPPTAGMISDLLVPYAGDESMRYALLGMSLLIGPWCAWHYFRAGKYLEGDLARKDDAA